jgi:hypothetical protein
MIAYSSNEVGTVSNNVAALTDKLDTLESYFTISPGYIQKDLVLEIGDAYISQWVQIPQFITLSWKPNWVTMCHTIGYGLIALIIFGTVFLTAKAVSEL